MTIPRTRYGADLALLVAFAMCAGGCVSALSPPGLDEQAAALHAIQLSPSTRYAVAARNSGMHEQPSYQVADMVSGKSAVVVVNKLGIQAVALSHAVGSDWSNELARAKEATGWVTAVDNEDFFRDAGFDGYVLITLYEEIEHYDGPKGHNNDREFRTFDPLYHIFALPRDQEKILLMRTGQDGRFSCETDDGQLENESVCVDTVVKRFRRKLDTRLERTDVN